MRLIVLFLRSRRTEHAVVILACATLLAWATGCAILIRPAAGPGYLTPVLVFAPLLAACAISAVASSPIGEAERTAASPLPTLRFVHLAGLLVGAAVAFLLVALAWDRLVAAPVLVRGLLGLSGMAFLAVRTLGSRLSWTLPVVFVAIISLVGDGSENRRWAWWAWVDQPAADPLSWTLAVASFALGFGLVCVSGAPGTAGGTQ